MKIFIIVIALTFIGYAASQLDQDYPGIPCHLRNPPPYFGCGGIWGDGGTEIIAM